MNLAGAAIVFALGAAASGHAAAGDLTASALRTAIAREGAAPVVHQLTAGSGTSWARVIDQIGSGRGDWLDVARALRPGVDAGSGEDLTSAVAAALKHNPAAVLSLTGPDFPIEQICTVPLIEPTDAQVKRWRDEVFAALRQVKDMSLSDKVAACRATMAQTK
jgi:hypothetical protein